MAAPKSTAFETEPADEFEDVALLLESDPEQQSSRKQPSRKDKFLNYFTRGNSRSHAGFEKLDQSDDMQSGSQRTQGVDRLYTMQQRFGVPCSLSTHMVFCKVGVAAADAKYHLLTIKHVTVLSTLGDCASRNPLHSTVYMCNVDLPSADQCQSVQSMSRWHLGSLHSSAIHSCRYSCSLQGLAKQCAHSTDFAAKLPKVLSSLLAQLVLCGRALES